jgi:hypothetical protein
VVQNNHMPEWVHVNENAEGLPIGAPTGLYTPARATQQRETGGVYLLPICHVDREGW